MIVCIFNGRRYVGQTARDPRIRWWQHKTMSKRPNPSMEILKAMQAHGADNFEFHILEKDIPLSELDRKEVFYIEQFDTLNPLKGYNSRQGGIGGYTMTERTRKKLSDANKRRHSKESPEKRKAHMLMMHAALKAKGVSESTKENLRKRMMGNTFRRGKKTVYSSPEVLERIRAISSKVHKGKILSEETKHKLRIKALARAAVRREKKQKAFLMPLREIAVTAFSNQPTNN